jgi:hypothetical protein
MVNAQKESGAWVADGMQLALVFCHSLTRRPRAVRAPLSFCAFTIIIFYPT